MTEEFIINPLIFYAIAVADNIKWLSTMVGFLATIASIVSYFGVSSNEHFYTKEQNTKYHRWIKRLFIIGAIGIFLSIFVPSQSTSYKMLLAYYGTKSNINYSINTIIEVSDKIIKQVNKK